MLKYPKFANKPFGCM